MEGFSIEGEVLDDFKKWLKKKSRKAIVEKTIPMKEEWTKMSKNLDKMIDKHKKIHDEIDSEKRRLLATIQLDINDFVSEIRINDKTNEIEFLKKDEDDKPGTPSPYQFE